MKCIRKTFIKLLSFSQDELIKVTNEKRMLGEQLKDFRDSNRAHLEIENKRLQDNLQNQKAEHEQNQKWLKSQNDTLMRKQQVNLDSVRIVPKPLILLQKRTNQRYGLAAFVKSSIFITPTLAKFS